MTKLFSLFVSLFLYFTFAIPTYAGNFIWPTHSDGISTYFSSWHPGIDIMTACGQPVVSSKWGNVTYAGWDNTGYGNLIMVDDGIDFEKYGHLSGFNVNYGQYVSQGQLIGWTGNTGNSYGCHLHFETHWYGWGGPPYGGAVDPFVALNN